MFRGLVLSAGFALCVVSLGGPAVAAPFSIMPTDTFSKQIEAQPDASCAVGFETISDAHSIEIADAAEALTDLCLEGLAGDTNLIAQAAASLSDWMATKDLPKAEFHHTQFSRALAALEAQAELLTISGATETPSPALVLEPLSPPAPEIALFTPEEAAVPFLGISDEATTAVVITVDAPGYVDNFTVYFPQGSVHLTLAAEDMIAMAAEAVRGMEGVEIWVSAKPSLSEDLALGREIVVETILMQNEVPTSWIHIDDGGLDAVLNRPMRLSDDMEA